MQATKGTARDREAAASDLTRTTLQLLFVGVLIAGSFWILRPFLVPMVWAATIVVSTWPAFARLHVALGGRRGAAVAVMTVLLLLVLVVPLYFAITTILENTDEIAGWSTRVAAFAAPEPPAWITALPFVGERIAGEWREIAAMAPEDISARLMPYARVVVGWFAVSVGSIGMMGVHFLLTVVISAILYARGEEASRALGAFARRLAGEQGENAMYLAAQAVQAVALGVVVTAFVQSCLGGIGLAVAGLPFATLLTALMFVCGVAQIGPAPVLIPAVAWTYWSEGAGWGSILLVWAILVGIMDNFLRPVLIRRGADLPLLLIFSGVLGGMIAFGVIGLFIGPVVLAVAYTLLAAWVAAKE